MTAATKNILIGIFVLLALAIAVFILLFLHPTVGDNGKTIRVRFTDIDKVNIGTRVTYAGKPVGEVVEIREIPESRANRTDRNGNIYVYELVLKIDSGVNIYNTDEIGVKTSGLLGEKNVAITPVPLKPGETLYLVDNETLYSNQGGTVEDTLRQFNELSKKISKILDTVDNTVQEIRREELVAKASRAIQNAADITDALNQPEKWNETLNNLWLLSERANHSWNTVDTSMQNIYSLTERAHRTLATIDRSFKNFDHSFESFARLTQRAHASWGAVDQSVQNVQAFTHNLSQSWPDVDQTIQNLKTASINTEEFTGKIRNVIDHTSRGEGTIGHLFVGNDLYLRLKSFLHKGQTIADDISKFGVLFHLNKDWQRLNARRLRLLQRLSTPTQFSAYFNRQLDEIGTSLSSVSMLLNETECYPESLLHNPTFATRFSELIRRVEGIEDSLKMYNEQVVDQECYQE